MKAKRTKVPELQAIYKADFWGERWGSKLWRSVFHRSNLPLVAVTKGIPIVSLRGAVAITIYVDPPHPKDRRGLNGRHRVYVYCPRCGDKVWAGRIHQHTC